MRAAHKSRRKSSRAHSYTPALYKPAVINPPEAHRGPKVFDIIFLNSISRNKKFGNYQTSTSFREFISRASPLLPIPTFGYLSLPLSPSPLAPPPPPRQGVFSVSPLRCSPPLALVFTVCFPYFFFFICLCFFLPFYSYPFCMSPANPLYFPRAARAPEPSLAKHH